MCSVDEVNEYIQGIANIEELKRLKEAFNQSIDIQIIMIEENQNAMIALNYIPNYGFQVTKGTKADLIIRGKVYDEECGYGELLKEVHCVRENTKEYKEILGNLIKKYNPDIIKVY